MSTVQLFIGGWVLLIAILAFLSHLNDRRLDRKAARRLQEIHDVRLNEITRSAQFNQADRWYHDF